MRSKVAALSGRAQRRTESEAALADAQGGLPDDWPWLDVDTQDKGRDIWATRTDPLSARRIPTSAESARTTTVDLPGGTTDLLIRVAAAPNAAVVVTFVADKPLEFSPAEAAKVSAR